MRTQTYLFLQNKFFSNDKKSHEMIDELYYKGILDDKDIDIIQNNKNINKDKNDGFER